MTGATASWLIPSLIGGVGAAASMMHGGGAEGSLYGYGPTEAGFTPTRASIKPTLLGSALDPIEQMIGVAMGRMRQPIPYVPPVGMLPWIGSNFIGEDPENPGRKIVRGGGGMFAPVGVTATDPGLRRADLLTRPGVNVGTGVLTPEYTGRGIAGSQFGTIPQPDTAMPQYGDGLPAVQNALNLLNEANVEKDAFSGNLSMGGTGLFTGANLGKVFTGPDDPEYADERRRRGGDVPNNNNDPTPPPASSYTTEPECVAADYVWDTGGPDSPGVCRG
jgi:hypothetical protein